MNSNDRSSPDREEFRSRLSPLAYAVMFEHGTERPGTSPLLAESRSGVFSCAACGEALFDAGTKFESGTGWPSFFDAIPGKLGTREDDSHGMRRVEYHCANCGAHQGHLFPDGPAPTGLRYCNNGVSLSFEPAED